LNISTFEFKQDDVLVENLKTMLEVVKKHGKKIIVNSDAHTVWQLADESPLENLKGRVDLPHELIINNYPEELLEFLNIQL
jgi:histidinol phosphatase-like PHP family hydrolase